MYWLVCVMKSHKMKYVDKIISNISAEECKIQIEKLQKDELGESKNTIQYGFFIIIYLIILNNMF